MFGITVLSLHSIINTNEALVQSFDLGALFVGSEFAGARETSPDFHITVSSDPCVNTHRSICTVEIEPLQLRSFVVIYRKLQRLTVGVAHMYFELCTTVKVHKYTIQKTREDRKPVPSRPAER